MQLIKRLFVLFLICLTLPLFAQDGEDEPKKDDDENLEFKFKAKGTFGSTTADGENYQLLGLQPEIGIGKFGLALDIQLLIDAEGEVREEDWDDGKDVIDKIFFISWGKKGDPIYAKLGGIKSTTLGYGIIFNGYNNTLDYPARKRLGLDAAFDTKYIGAEFIANDVRDAFVDDAGGFMGGTRVYARPMSRLTIGVSYAGDLNEYNGFTDNDDDGFPDEIDAYPNDNRYGTDYSFYEDQADTATADSLVSSGLISGTKDSDLENFSDQTSRIGFYSTDIAINIIKSKKYGLDLYSQYAYCHTTEGWGFSLPGVQFRSGILTFSIEYTQKSDDFYFGYFNGTYDLERASYVDDGSGNLVAQTKKDQLDQAVSGRGYRASAQINIVDLLLFKTSYSDIQGDIDDRSLSADLTVHPKILPKIAVVRAYFTQNNVQEIEWKTPSTIMGAMFKLDFKAAKVECSYQVTYEDKDGDGEIKRDDETIKTVYIATSTIW